ncbi:MAG TPA: hypothetical protein VGM59_02530 [Dongiaceae bacterium]
MVPDVLLTFLAVRRGPGVALRAALSAAAGAILGGAIMLGWAHADAALVERAIDMVPGIDGSLIARVKSAVSEAWLPALLLGAFSGAPYKLYATAAGEQGIAVLPFLAMTFVARLSRFVLSVFLAHVLAGLLRRFGRRSFVVPAWAVWWVGFYAVYWTVMS